MKKKHNFVKFSCSSCSSVFNCISSHSSAKGVNIEICSNCHPFYMGKINFESSLGPAEKLKDKFQQGKNYINSKKK